MDLSNIKRILIIRTDRIGDVVLSTPVITAVRSFFSDAYIAVMVSSETRDIVIKNPYLNEVIVYDKKTRHRGLFQTMDFILRIKRKRFDLALILHSTNRVNLISFLSGIPKRVGYARGKMDFLLTHRLEYKKRLGEKHESEYSLDILRSLGINTGAPRALMLVGRDDEKDIDILLKETGLEEGQKFIVVHPGASCISKMWPLQNFAKLSDELIKKFNVRIVLISSREQVKIGEDVKGLMEHKPIFLCGKTSLGQLAALFKRVALFISNDSGPVHIAWAVGAPVISIFGRNEKGLSPVRWRPLGEKSVAIHKEVGCVKCDAHNCKKDFLCLSSITVEEVMEKAGQLLKVT